MFRPDAAFDLDDVAVGRVDDRVLDRREPEAVTDGGRGAFDDRRDAGGLAATVKQELERIDLLLSMQLEGRFHRWSTGATFP